MKVLDSGTVRYQDRGCPSAKNRQTETKSLSTKKDSEERITTGNSELRPAFEASNRQPLGIDYPVINNIDKDGFYAINITKSDSERRKLVSTSK